MTSEKGDLTVLTIPELESQGVYTNVTCLALQFTFVKPIFTVSAQFLNQQTGSFYNCTPDKQLPHKCIYKVLLHANIYFCRQTPRKCHSTLAAAEQIRRVASRTEDAKTESKARGLAFRAVYLPPICPIVRENSN